MLGDIIIGFVEMIVEVVVEIIFKTFINSIGAAIRWLFFLGRYSYFQLFGQSGRNITIAILALILFMGCGFWLHENSKEEPQEQEVSLIIKTKLSNL